MFVCMLKSVFDVLALYEDGLVSLSATAAAGKTSVAPHPLWADRRGLLCDKSLMSDDLRQPYLLFPSVYVQERISESEGGVMADSGLSESVAVFQSACYILRSSVICSMKQLNPFILRYARPDFSL